MVRSPAQEASAIAGTQEFLHPLDEDPPEDPPEEPPGPVQWHDEPPPTGIVLEVQPDRRVFGAGDEVNFLADANDEDTREHDDVRDLEGDVLTFTWDDGGAGGRWKNGENTGRTVTWIAPDTGGDVRITVTMTDAAVIPEGDVGDRDDPDQSEWCDLTVIGVSTSEPRLFVPVNDDDDNGNGIPDISETGPVVGEDDVRAISYGWDTGGLEGGILALHIAGAPTAGKIKLWKYPTKGTPAETHWDLDTEQPLGTVFIEGEQASAAMEDVLLEVTLAVEGGATTKYVKITVVQVDLDIAGVGDAGEFDPGVLVGLNSDDDDASQTADKDELGPVTGENDLVALSLSYAPSGEHGLDSGTIELTAASGASKVALWQAGTKGTGVALPSSWEVPGQQPPPTVYLEGVECSDALRDVTLKLAYIPPSPYVGHEDKVAATVVGVESVTAEKAEIVAGGVADAPHQTAIEAQLRPALPGFTVAFSADHEYNHQAPSVAPAAALTGEDGKAHCTVTSGDGVVSGNVTASCGSSSAAASVGFAEPLKELSIVEPITGAPVEWLWADGQSRCKVILGVTYQAGPISMHDVEWLFRFWNADDDPSVDEPAYQGTGYSGSPYGTLGPVAGQTDAEGKTDTIYTAGTVGGSIEFVATDRNVYLRGSWKESQVKRSLGEQGGSIPMGAVGVWWMQPGYTEPRPWQWHIALNNETLYPLVKLKPKIEHGTVPQTVQIRVWSFTDPAGFQMQLQKQAGPDGEGTYKYWPGSGQEPKVGPQTNAQEHVIGVSHSESDGSENTTHDNGPLDVDSNVIAWGTPRGYGRWFEDEDTTTLWADLEYLKCAGVEKLGVRWTDSTTNQNYEDYLPAKNQADLLYFSGHGYGELGVIWGGNPDPGQNRLGFTSWEEIQPATHWSVDLDLFVISGCSVLNIGNLTGHGANPGLDWASNCIAGRTPGGPLDGLCGYHAGTYLDATGVPALIAAAFSTRFNGSNGPTAWRDANNAVENTPYAAMDASTYYWKKEVVPGYWQQYTASY